MKPINITDAEYQIMNILWKTEQGTSRELSEILHHTMGWKPATTKTLLGRLAKKNLITTEQQGNHYLYRPAVSEEQALAHSVDDFLDKVCAKSIGEVVLHIVDTYDINSDDLATLQTAVNNKIPNDSIACDCVPSVSGKSTET